MWRAVDIKVIDRQITKNTAILQQFGQDGANRQQNDICVRVGGVHLID